MEDTTKFLQCLELDMVKEFVHICDKHGLKYFMAGGTFLGAVRHKGFIPWDDDVDMGMYRCDYDKFLKIAESELSYPYKIQTYQNTESHHYYFTHIIDMRYKVRRLGSIDKREEHVWIDIFPYDGLPNGIIGNLFYLKLLFYRFCYHMANFDKINIARTDRAIWQKIVLKVLSIMHKFFRFDKYKWINKIDILLKSNNLQNCDRIMSFMGMKLHKEILPREIYDDLIDYAFEDMNLKGPKESTRVLRQLYGNYYELPPENKRKSHPMEVLNDDLIH